MKDNPQLITFADFESQLRQIFDRLHTRSEPILVERDGETYRVERDRSDIWADYDPEKVQGALKASIGVLKGVDVDELIRDIDAQREQGEGRFE